MLLHSRSRTMVLAAGLLLLLGGCTASTSSPSGAAQPTDGMPGMPSMPGMTGMGDMPGMGDVTSAPTTPALAAAAPRGTGLSSTLNGYTLVTAPGGGTFRITGPNGKTVTRYQPYESEFVLCYVIRADLTEFHYLQPAMREDGTWTVTPPSLPTGSYRTFVSFAAPDSSKGTPLVYQLSSPFTIHGTSGSAPTASADAYTLSLSGIPKAGTSGPLTVTVTATKNGKPVTSFERFLDAYVHLTAFHAGDLAFAHIFSLGGVQPGTGTTTAEALFPESGTWRVFAQFEVGGTVQTAALTINVP